MKKEFTFNEVASVALVGMFGLILLLLLIGNIQMNNIVVSDNNWDTNPNYFKWITIIPFLEDVMVITGIASALSILVGYLTKSR